ncbi:MAG: ABC transporter substrate-binding protein [Candidatus Limnocylindria bacterium]
MQATRRARRGRRGTSALLVAILALAVTGCGLTSRPTIPPDASAAPLPPGPTLPPSTAIPFEASAYPRSGAAPCDELSAPDSEHGPYTGNLRRIRADDASTVVFELCRPDVAFPARLAHPSFGIADSGWLASQIEPDGDGEPAILSVINGTGPFRFEVWQRGTDLSLLRHEGYWGAVAEPERLVFTWAESATDRLAALRDGTVDGIDGLSAADTVAAQELDDVVIAPRSGLGTLYLGMNQRYAPFDSELVRRAIGIGLDRARIVREGFPAGTAAASHWTSCAIQFGCAGSAWLAFDPVRATELLDEGGYPEGFSTTLRYPDAPRDYLPDPEGTATTIRDQLLEIGIDAALQAVDFDTLVADAEAGRLDGLHLLGARPRVADVSAVLDPRFGSGSPGEFGTPIDAVVTALDAGAATTDPEARERSYARVNGTLRIQVPAVPLAHPAPAAAFLSDVRDAVASPTGTEWFAAMTPGDRRQLVWRQASEPGSLFCADETEADALRACAQVSEGLFGYAVGGATIEPRLATGCTADDALLTWTCTLRDGVRFHDGSRLDAADVVDTFALQWDADHPRHRGRTGSFETFVRLFGGFLNPPAAG